MTNEMWWIATIIMFVTSVIIWGKKNFPRIAKQNDNSIFGGIKVIAIEEGEIVVLQSGGKTTRVLGNVSKHGHKVDKESGLVSDLKSGDINHLDTLWYWLIFGVVILWWGESVRKSTSGKNSISLISEDEFEMNAVECEDEITSFNFKVRITYELTDPIKQLRIEDWKDTARFQAQAAINAQVLKMTANEFWADDAEKDESELRKSILFLNCDSGNASLEKTTGSKIVRFSLNDKDYSDSIKQAMESKKLAQQKKLADLENVDFQEQSMKRLAIARLAAAKDDATALGLIKAEIGENGAVKIRTAEVMADAIKTTKVSALALGETCIPSLFGNTKKEESEKDGDQKKKKK